MKKVNYLLILLVTISMFSVAARKAIVANDLLGTWKYTVTNVPPEYETGFMTFEQKDDKTVGYLGSTEKMEMKELTIDQSKITFKLDFQGGLLTFTLTQDGEKLSGTIVSQDGEFPITAVKEAQK
jgi:hypothetical protein